MPRIEPIDDQRAGLLAKLAYFLARRRVRRVPSFLRIVAHSANLLAGYGAFELFLERARAVEPRLAHLAALRVASLVGCAF